MKLPLPSLSVVIPNFNHGLLISDQLQSVFSQTVQPTKTIIIDDASTDNSISTIQRVISGRANVELICKKSNSGVSTTMNEGLRLSDSEYIAFLAADDRILPQLFEKSLTLLSSHRDAGLCSSISLVEYQSGDYVLPYWTAYPRWASAFLTPTQVRNSLMKIESWFMGNTTLFRREALLAVGGFDPDLFSFSDGFVSRVLALRYGACFIPEPLGIWRRADAGYASSTVRDEHKYEQVLIRSNTQMAGTFKDLFPPQLLARSNARMLFHVLCAKLDSFERRTLDIVEVARPVGGIWLLLRFVRCAKVVLKLVLFMALRSYDLPRVALSRIGWRRRPRLLKILGAK